MARLARSDHSEAAAFVVHAPTDRIVFAATTYTECLTFKNEGDHNLPTEELDLRPRCDGELPHPYRVSGKIGCPEPASPTSDLGLCFDHGLMAFA